MFQPMRGTDTQQSSMFSYLSPEKRVPANHPLRPIRLMVDDALKALSPAFSRLYSAFGRPSIPPEKLLRALLLQVLYTVRSERMLMEQLEYNLLFRWFVGLNMDETVWVPTVFSKNRTGFWKGISPRSSSPTCWLRRGLPTLTLGGTLHGGRNTDRGVGEPEEFSAEGIGRHRRTG